MSKVITDLYLLVGPKGQMVVGNYEKMADRKFKQILADREKTWKGPVRVYHCNYSYTHHKVSTLKRPKTNNLIRQ